MPTILVIGAQWGDEGKGKIVDYLAQRSEIIVRYNGGPNAGHTVVNKYGEFRLHLIPSGIFNQRALSVIGNGVVIDPEVLVKEIKELKRRGISCQNLRISDKAHLILPWHILLDKKEEEKRRKKRGKPIGTTLRGIGPAFSDKASRFGVRVGEIRDVKKFKEKLYFLFEIKRELLRTKKLSFPKIYKRLLYLRRILLPYLAQTEFILWKALSQEKNILLEGAQGSLLDIDFGTYPHVTSTSCLSAGASQGTGIPLKEIDTILGVVKAYNTRVGSDNQPFPTEMPEREGNFLRERANEYGATTGRPRRCGWLDLVLLKYVTKVNGFDYLALTRLDCLTGFEKLKICVGYKKKGKEIPFEKFSLFELEEYQPIYVELPGWKEFPKNCQNFSDLPENAKKYIKKIEDFLNLSIKLISFGPEREKILDLYGSL